LQVMYYEPTSTLDPRHPRSSLASASDGNRPLDRHGAVRDAQM
jgi:hypothetical protein